MTKDKLNKKKKGSWIKTDYDKLMNKTMDNAWNLSASIAENKYEVSILAPIGVSIQILLEELLFDGYSETKAKEVLDKSLTLAVKNHKDFIKKSSKKKNGS
jgi:hypothetical protein